MIPKRNNVDRLISFSRVTVKAVTEAWKASPVRIAGGTASRAGPRSGSPESDRHQGEDGEDKGQPDRPPDHHPPHDVCRGERCGDGAMEALAPLDPGHDGEGAFPAEVCMAVAAIRPVATKVR